MEHPTHGLGAAALRAWLEKTGIPAYRLAERIPVSAASMSSWLHAGWLEGGNLPAAHHRKRIEIVTDGEVKEHLFAEDDERRRAHARNGSAGTALSMEAP